MIQCYPVRNVEPVAADRKLAETIAVVAPIPRSLVLFVAAVEDPNVTKTHILTVFL